MVRSPEQMNLESQMNASDGAAGSIHSKGALPLAVLNQAGYQAIALMARLVGQGRGETACK